MGKTDHELVYDADMSEFSKSWVQNSQGERKDQSGEGGQHFEQGRTWATEGRMEVSGPRREGPDGAPLGLGGVTYRAWRCFVPCLTEAIRQGLVLVAEGEASPERL